MNTNLYLYIISTRNPYAINHQPQFELADLMSPTKLLCKVDQVMDAYSGQIDVHEV